MTSAVVAALLATAALVAPPSVASASFDEAWHKGLQPTLESSSKAWGAYAKDMADKKIVNDVLVRADFSKYMIAGGFTLALVAIDVALTLLINEPSFEEQVMDRLNEIRAEMHQMQFDLDALEASLEQILNQTQMAEFRSRHQILTSAVAPIFAYQELLDIYTDPDIGTSDFAKRILVDNIIENVPAARTDIIEKVTPGLTSLPAAYNAAAQPETALDDRDYYEAAFDYLAYWERVLEMANRQLLEAYNWKLRQPSTSEFEVASLQAEIDKLVNEQPNFQNLMWSEVSHPISNDDFVTLGNYALLPRDHTSIDADDPLRYDQYEWLNLTRQNWDDLLAAGAGGSGETLRAQLADQGLAVPSAIDLLEPDSYRAKAWVYGWIGGSQYGLRIEENYSIRCTWVGFTETVTVTTQWVWGANGSKIYDDSPITYHSGDTACLNPAHFEDAAATPMPAADLRGSDGAMFDTGGMPALASNVWWISPEGSVEVYEDGELVERVTETTGLTPGIVDELTFTTDAGDIPSSGWAVYADPATDDGFVGKFAGSETTTLELAPGETSLIATLPPAPPRDGATIDVSSVGGGSVVLIEDGQAIDVVDTDGSIQLPADVTTLVVTDDADDAWRGGLTMVAAPDDDEEFFGWFGDASGAGRVEIEIDPSKAYKIGAQLNDEPTPINVEITGPGTVDVYHDGAIVDSTSDAVTVLPHEFVGELALTTDPGEIPATGWALLAHPDEMYELRRWSDEHDAASTRATVGADAEFHISPTFTLLPATYEITIGGPGAVDLYENGDLVGTTSGGTLRAIDHHDTVTVTADPAGVPADGIALLARGQHDHVRFVGFGGAASGSDTQILEVDPGTTVPLAADFTITGFEGGLDVPSSRVGPPSSFTGSNTAETGGGTVQIVDGQLSNLGTVTAAWWYENWDGSGDNARLNLDSLSFDVDDDGRLTNGSASGDLRLGDVWGFTNYSLGTPTGTLNAETGRLTVIVPANGAASSTLVFDLDPLPDTGPILFEGNLDRSASRISDTSLYWAQGTITGDSTGAELTSSRLAGQVNHYAEHEFLEITRLELAFDSTGAATATSLSGEIRTEGHHPGLPPLAVDALVDVHGHFDAIAGELRLDVVDEHGTTRANLVIR